MLLLHRAVNMVHRSLNTPLNPSQLHIRCVHRPTMLETWSQQGLAMYALRTLGREPLRSASRPVGCISNSRLWESWPLACGGS